jgi:hypothetical protein
MEKQVSTPNTTTTIPIRRPPSSNQPEQHVPDYPSETISLPSKGWFYEDSNPLSSGQVEMKMMTAKEEDILTNQNYIQKGVVFQKLLRSLILDPNININDILLMDQNSLMLAARRLAYGDKYKVKVSCPRCSEENDISIDLSEIKDSDIDVEKFPRGLNEFEFTLPKSGVVIKYKLLNQKDQESIDSETRVLRKINKNESSDVTTRLRHIITSVNGNTDKIYIKNFVLNMLSFDAKSLRDHMIETLPSVDMTFNFECSSCSHLERMDVPMTVQFFWPDSGR